MAGRERAGAKKTETGQVIGVGFAGKAKAGCGSCSQAHAEVRQVFRLTSSLCPHVGNSCQHVSTSVNTTKTAAGLLTSTVQ